MSRTQHRAYAAPSPALAAALQQQYDHFNRALFAGQLARVLFTRAAPGRTVGYFRAAAWRGERRRQAHEIALDLAAARSPVEIAIGLVHNMIHAAQHDAGTENRPGYHGTDFASRALAIGLIPTATGKPGGARTGQHVDLLVAPDGPFALAWRTLPPAARLPWRSLDAAERRRSSAERGKVRYACGCSVVWGRRRLSNLWCTVCRRLLVEETR